MAIAFDAVSSSTATGVSSHSWSHTCTGNNRVLVVCIEVNSGSPFKTLSSLTYNGVAMTEKVAVDATGLWGVWWYVYTLLNPSTGANNIAATFSGSATTIGIGTSYTGVASIGNTGNLSTTGANPSISITTTAANSYVVGGLDTNGQDPTVNGLTERAEITSANGHIGNVGDKLVAAAGATSADWTKASGIWTGAAVELVESVVSGPTNVKTFDDVTQSTGIKTYLGTALASTKSVNGLT